MLFFIQGIVKYHNFSEMNLYSCSQRNTFFPFFFLLKSLKTVSSRKSIKYMIMDVLIKLSLDFIFDFRICQHLSVESESRIDSVSFLWCNLNGNIAIANSAAYEQNRHWMRFEIGMFDASNRYSHWDLRKYHSFVHMSNFTSNFVYTLSHYTYLRKRKCVDFLLEKCWWYLNILRAHFTCVYVAPIANKFRIHRVNAHARQNNEHSEFHFDCNSTLALEKFKHDTNWPIKQLLRLFILKMTLSYHSSEYDKTNDISLAENNYFYE